MAVGAGDEVWLVPTKICGATTASEVGVAAGLGVATTEVAAETGVAAEMGVAVETGVAAGTGTSRRSNWSMLSFVLISCSSILPWFSRILMMSGFVGGGAAVAGVGDGDAQRFEDGGGGGDVPALFSDKEGKFWWEVSAGGAVAGVGVG